MTPKKVKLGSVARVLNGYAFKSKEYVANGIRIVRITNVQKGRIQDDNPKFVDIGRSCEFARFMLDDGDILISLTGNVGRVGVIDQSMLPAALNQRVGALKVTTENVEPAYLFHVLNSDNFEQEAIKNSKGVAQLNLSSKWIENYEIPLPPLAEQKRIAGLLDAADALRAKRHESLAQLDTLLQSTFLDMFGDPVTNPMGWEVKKLKDMSTRIMSGTTPKGGREVYVEEGIVFFRSQNVWRNRLELDEIAYIDSETHSKMSKSSLQNKDILMTKTGRINTENSSLGRAAMFLGPDDSANINGHVYLIRLHENSIHEFVLFILTTNEYRDYIRRVCVGGIDKRQLNKKHLEEFPVVFPPLDLQRRFAAILESVEHQKASLRIHLDELNTLFASMQSRAFRGDL